MVFLFLLLRDNSVVVNGTLENNGDGVVSAGAGGGVSVSTNSAAAAAAKKAHALRCATRRRQREDVSHARLDILFLLLFPLFFLMFNAIYWVYFLYGHNEETKHSNVNIPIVPDTDH